MFCNMILFVYLFNEAWGLPFPKTVNSVSCFQIDLKSQPFSSTSSVGAKSSVLHLLIVHESRVFKN